MRQNLLGAAALTIFVMAVSLYSVVVEGSWFMLYVAVGSVRALNIVTSDRELLHEPTIFLVAWFIFYAWTYAVHDLIEGVQHVRSGLRAA